MFWIGYYAGMLTFTGIVLSGLVCLVIGIFKGLEQFDDSFWPMYRRLWAAILLVLSCVVLGPLVFSHYSTVGLQIFFSFWFVILSLVCVAATTIWVARYKEFYEISIVTRLKTKGKQRWTALAKLLGCALILALSEPYASGIVKNALNENGNLTYHFTPSAQAAADQLREDRSSSVATEIEACVELHRDLSEIPGGMLRGASAYNLPSGRMWAWTSTPTEPGDALVADVTFVSKRLFERCEFNIDWSLGLALQGRQLIDIHLLISGAAITIANLKQVKARAPIGFLMGTLFGYLEILSTLKVSEYCVEPEGTFSKVIDRCILVCDLLIVFWPSLWYAGNPLRPKPEDKRGWRMSEQVAGIRHEAQGKCAEDVLRRGIPTVISVNSVR